MTVAAENIVETSAVEYSHDAGSRPGSGAKALDGITLNIVRGEFVALVGRNGSGKSTLARHLNALLLPTGGVVRINGMDTRDETGLWDLRRGVGMLFQDPDNQIIGTTVEEDTAFGPENLGLSPEVIEVRVRAALHTVGMADHADRAPHLLSGGEKQRLALAGVLAMKPECIILDEATSMLDPSAREEIMGLLRRLNREEGITVLHITHRMEEAALADRIVVMDAGRVVLEGKPGEVFSEVSLIRELGLELPPVTELFDLLMLDGFDLPAGITDTDEALEALMAINSSRMGDVHIN
jgi:energy-coupling factor transport system ATP-binding protein